MIKATKFLSEGIIEINPREELNNAWPVLCARTYQIFTRTMSFWIDDKNYRVDEIKRAKWYQKRPNCRPVGKPRFKLTVTTWDENGENPQYREEYFETLAKLEKSI